MVYKNASINSRICKKKDLKKKARKTQLKVYINRRVFFAMGGGGRRLEEVRRVLVEERTKKERLL